MKNSDSFFMDLAKRAADQSRCLSRKCGAVIAFGNDPISFGFNGPQKDFPNPGTKEFNNIFIDKYNLRPGQINKLEEGICPRKIIGYASGEGTNFCPCSHAEKNAISNAAKLGRAINNCSIYIYAEVSSCMECANSVVGAGIIEVIMDSLDSYEGYGFSGIDIYKNCGIKIRKPNYVN